ncbi:MAG: hypothetical protein K2X66_00705 [Cyanobacteria bacterium]|nr:hypothetical protein [Cyanobacteriota bacterium]
MNLAISPQKHPSIPFFSQGKSGSPSQGYFPPLKFGDVSFRDILTLSPPTILTSEQERVLSQFEKMAQTKDLGGLPAHPDLKNYLDLMGSSEYKHVIYIVHKDFQHPSGKVVITQRERFHSPFTDLFSALQSTPQLQKEVILGLSNRIQNPSNEDMRKNAIEALVDIYFYNLRPQGKCFDLFRTLQKLVNPKISGKAYPYQHRKLILNQFKALLTQPQTPLKSKRLLRNELIFGLHDIEHSKRPQMKRVVRQNISPLANTPLENYPTPSASSINANNILIQKLKTALLEGNLDVLNQMIDANEMSQLIPEWERVKGPNHHQHLVQDYNLRDHLLFVLQATQKSIYYQRLTPEEKFRVSTAAFFHDISKRTGPPNFRDAGRVQVDFHHPGRSAETALECLPQLGYTPEQVKDIVTLIQYHQLLGNIAKPDGDPLNKEKLKSALAQLGTPSVLKMLCALTEGDVRCVRFDIPGRTWFDASLQSNLSKASQTIENAFAKRNP